MAGDSEKSPVKAWAVEQFERVKAANRMTQADLGRALGISQPQARALLYGSRRIAADEIPLLEKFFGAKFGGSETVGDIRHDKLPSSRIPKRGKVAAGLWLETAPFLDDWEITEYVDGLAAPSTLEKYTYGLEVQGDSVNRVAPHGSILICLDILSGVEIMDRDLVIVERIRDQGALREVTAKRLVRRGDEIVLVPESNDPRWQTEIVVSDDPYQMDAEVRIVAKVKHVVMSV